MNQMTVEEFTELIRHHWSPYCEPNQPPPVAEADGVVHSPYYYDFDRNKPFPQSCCENDHNGDGNCHVHSAPGVFRNAGIEKGMQMRRRMDCVRCGGIGLLSGTAPIWDPEAGIDKPGEGSQICPVCKDGKA